MGDVVSTWARSQPTTAAQWATDLPSGEVRDEALASAASGWAGESVNEAAAWLKTLPRDGRYDAAVGGFAGAVFETDADGALEWVRTIKDPARRAKELQAAWKSWAMFHFPEAEKWRAESKDLTTAERASLVLRWPE